MGQISGLAPVASRTGPGSGSGLTVGQRNQLLNPWSVSVTQVLVLVRPVKEPVIKGV